MRSNITKSSRALQIAFSCALSLTFSVCTGTLLAVAPIFAQEDTAQEPAKPEPVVPAVNPAVTPAIPSAKPDDPLPTNPDSSQPLLVNQINPASQVQNESPAAFLQRYLDAKHKAKTQMDLAAFYEPHKFEIPAAAKANPEQLKEAMKMMEVFYQLDKLATPKTAKVISTTPQGSDVLLLTRSVESAPLNAGMTTYTGKYLLRKGASGWIVIKETSSTDDGKGSKFKISDEGAKASPQSATDRYKDAISAAVDKAWHPDNKTKGNVEAVLLNSAKGGFKIVNVKDKDGSLAAEMAVKTMLAKLVLPPLPASFDQPCIYLQLSWAPDKASMRCTQYFKDAWVVSQPEFRAKNGQPISSIAWASEGKNDAFKQQPFGGNLEGQNVKFLTATIELDEYGYEIKFRPSESQDYPCVSLFLRTKEDLTNKTLYIPLPPSKGPYGDLEGTTFYRHTGQRSSGVSDGIGGRIQFMQWKDGKLGGYFTIRVASGGIKASTLNGYFYAVQKK